MNMKPTTTNANLVSAWILNDQLMHPERHPTLLEAVRLADGDRDQVRVVIIESYHHFSALPYHKKRLAFIISAGRHFAEELRSKGWQVDCISAESFRQGLRKHRETHSWKQCVTMRAAENSTSALQEDLKATFKDAAFEIISNGQFYWPQTENAKPTTKNVVMENFYRIMRRHFQLLMKDDKKSPVGDQWNFDADNRKPLPKKHVSPDYPKFEPDEMTSNVLKEVNSKYPDHVGTTNDFYLPVTRQQSELAFGNFLDHRLNEFGPYEDAMSQASGTLWHSMMSPVMNLGLIDALEMCRAAESRYRSGLAPINSVEGFIRQVIGWREYMHWQYCRTSTSLRTANKWNHNRPLPQFWWDGQTDMACLKTIISRLIDTGYNHHIERLMVLCNYAMLAGINPEAVANWFLTMYVDSHDWVVLTNVIGMGLNADGGKIATKPYIASGAYIHKMSDFCGGCKYNPKQRTGADACPFNTLYWNFLIQNETTLRSNPRMGPNVLGLRHISGPESIVIQKEADEYFSNLDFYDGPEYQPDDE